MNPKHKALEAKKGNTLSSKSFAKIHKKKTGYSLKSEQVTGSSDEFKGKSMKQLYDEAKAFGKKHK